MQGKLFGLCPFPQTAGVGSSGHLIIGGCDTVDLAATFDDPLYVFNETILHNKCLEYLHEFSKCYTYTRVIYTCKALIRTALASLLKERRVGARRTLRRRNKHCQVSRLSLK